MLAVLVFGACGNPSPPVTGASGEPGRDASTATGIDAGQPADAGAPGQDASAVCGAGGDAGYLFSIDDPRVKEGSGGGLTALTFTVTLAPAAPFALTVDYATADGVDGAAGLGGAGATAGVDYTAVSGRLTFAAGVTSQAVTVQVAADEVDETGGEYLTLDLCNPSGNAGFADAVGQGSIIDDDPVDGTLNVQRTYVQVTDGVKLAVIALFPDDYQVGRRYPTKYQTSGYANSIYPGGWPPGFPRDQDDSYVRVEVSARGTGCSGGTYDLWSVRDIQDHYDVIESWVVAQPWSNQRVAVVGFSYWGNMGFRIAALNPPHVNAVAVGGLIDDLYRGAVHLGHVTNAGFPVGWLAGIGGKTSGALAMTYRGNDELAAGNPACRDHTAGRPPTVGYALLEQVLTDVDDNPYFRTHSLATYAPNIRVPIHLRHMYQDEQTGPSGALLFERIPTSTPKRLVLANGRHAGRAGVSDSDAWLDCWMLKSGEGCPGDITDAGKRVRLYLESAPGANPPAASAAAADYPLPGTVWQALYLRAGKALSVTPPASDEAADVFATETGGEPFTRLTGTHASVSYAFPVGADTVVAGPLVLDLYANILGADADLFVEIVDQFPDGAAQYVQSGVLRGTERALDLALSKTIATGAFAGEIIQPHHPHAASAVLPVSSGATVRMQIGVWPLGHVFRAGHQFVVRVSSPPFSDRITGGSYQYASELPSVKVELLHRPGSASRLLVPTQPAVPAPPASASSGCGQSDGLPCATLPPDEGTASTGTAGCLVKGGEPGTGSRSCSFVATGNHDFVGYSPNAASIRVCRAGVEVGLVSKLRVLDQGSAGQAVRGVVTAAPGDTIEARLVANDAPDSFGRGGRPGTWGYLAVGNPSAGGVVPTVPCP
ncbi:MAG: hypothetical protein HY904_06325 [Deltaproteobacteria bacterium]|nr:hypothetical protein [Deltaproteobacteria bacterium]